MYAIDTASVNRITYEQKTTMKVLKSVYLRDRELRTMDSNDMQLNPGDHYKVYDIL